jgi:hypothetical protein
MQQHTGLLTNTFHCLLRTGSIATMTHTVVENHVEQPTSHPPARPCPIAHCRNVTRLIVQDLQPPALPRQGRDDVGNAA